jgi:hypothetical protein
MRFRNAQITSAATGSSNKNSMSRRSAAGKAVSDICSKKTPSHPPAKTRKETIAVVQHTSVRAIAVHRRFRVIR